MIAELLVLRVVRVLGAIFWLGSGLFTTLFLIPAPAQAGPAAAPVMGALQGRRLFRRDAVGMLAATVMLVLAAIGMAVARYR